MIHAQTAFVVGAGGSCVYQLPSGSGMLEEARGLDVNAELCKLMQTQRPKSEVNVLAAVLDDLRNHASTSIDAYLQTRQHKPEILEIGRRLIALLLEQSLRNKFQLPGLEDDWFRYIFDRMSEGCSTFQDFMKNEVIFITFNFDTIIEDRFRDILAATFDDYQGELFPEVIHIHGETPRAPSWNESFNIHGRVVFADEGVEWLSQAASQIRVVFDQNDQPTVDRARAALDNSRTICFLGFAYAEPNLRRLGFLDSPGVIGTNPAKAIFGSAFGLLEGEQLAVKAMLKNVISLGETKWGCRDSLRRLPVFARR
jgi:hypothetical protein